MSQSHNLTLLEQMLGFDQGFPGALHLGREQRSHITFQLLSFTASPPETQPTLSVTGASLPHDVACSSGGQPNGSEHINFVLKQAAEIKFLCSIHPSALALSSDVIILTLLSAEYMNPRTIKTHTCITSS